MKKFEQRYCVRAQSNTAQLNAQHNKLHTHENDHRLNSILNFLTTLPVLTFCKSK